MIIVLVMVLLIGVWFVIRPWCPCRLIHIQNDSASERDSIPPTQPADSSSPVIQVLNLANGQSVGYPLLLIHGRASADCSQIILNHVGRTSEWPVVETIFRSLVMLTPGSNRIRLSAADHPDTVFHITHAPVHSSKRVRLLYVLASDSDGSFQAPPGEDNDLASAVRRISVAGLLQQTAIAELLHQADMPRKTFQLETNYDQSIDVGIIRLPMTLNQIYSLSELQIWLELDAFLRKSDPAWPDRKYMAYLSMTRFDPVSRSALAHTALGGGNLALYGGGNLHTWPQSIDEIPRRFSDVRHVSDYGLFDDSSFRGTFWANFTTGLGASLHELGHVFGLSHSGYAPDLMERGFDHINHLFMPMEDSRPIPSPSISLAVSSANLLVQSSWLLGYSE